ncbi:MAG TPA: tetratricopeptide repeat protein [Steroidobacteraceae bacterium]|nr:tetratricopeptide repeat protein [Steroidobacteraceae bacterium]
MNALRRGAALLTLLTLAACTLPRPAVPPAASGAAQGAALSPVQLLAAVQRDADRIDRSTDSAERAQLLAAATDSARQCLAQAPEDAACPYAQAQVQGLGAREHPLEAPSLLKQMLANLAKAEALDAALDHAGPARLTAVVLLRAPPWPLGPGDVDAAKAAAQRAVQRDPGYPPNLITLGQAQAKSDGAPAARATFDRARQAVQEWGGAPNQSSDLATEREQWRRAVEQGLKDLQ